MKPTLHPSLPISNLSLGFDKCTMEYLQFQTSHRQKAQQSGGVEKVNKVARTSHLLQPQDAQFTVLSFNKTAVRKLLYLRIVRRSLFLSGSSQHGNRNQTGEYKVTFNDQSVRRESLLLRIQKWGGRFWKKVRMKEGRTCWTCSSSGFATYGADERQRVKDTVGVVAVYVVVIVFAVEHKEAI